MIEYISLIITGGLTIAALWWFFAFEYAEYRLELLRHRLFVIRDDLFISASHVDIPFDSTAYGMTRITLNGMIRMAHKLSLIQFFMIKVFVNKNDFEVVTKDFKKSYAAALAQLTLEQRKIIMESYVKAHICILSHIIHTSILLFPIAVMVRPFHKMDLSSRKFLIRGRKYRDKWLAVDAAANSIGQDAMEPLPLAA